MVVLYIVNFFVLSECFMCAHVCVILSALLLLFTCTFVYMSAFAFYCGTYSVL